ncbi:MAG TPA: ABC transporter ATP-binding protein [Ktedonobacterales bacterium]
MARSRGWAGWRGRKDHAPGDRAQVPGASATPARAPSEHVTGTSDTLSGGARERALGDASVETTHVFKRLGTHLAVIDVSVKVGRGELFALVGPSGSGKTSLVRLMCGIYAPDVGTVRLLGHDRLPWPPALKVRFGYMPQGFTLYPRLTVTENLRYAAALYGVDRATRERRLAEVIDLVDLGAQRDRLGGDLSGGQRRRLALAAPLMHDPELLFVDEPTAGLDPDLRARLWSYFRRIVSLGQSVVVTTQYLDEAELTDRVAVMRQGELVAAGSPADLARMAFGGEVVELRSADLTAAAARDLMQLEGVHEVTFADLETLRVVVVSASDAAPRLIAALVRAGCSVGAVTLRQPRFEDVFLRLVGDAGRFEPSADAELRTGERLGALHPATDEPDLAVPSMDVPSMDAPSTDNAGGDQPGEDKRGGEDGRDGHA